jgi:serine/threonine-protein kinase
MGQERQSAPVQDRDEDIPEGVVVGETLAGKYQVDRVLGAGGMGVVVQATHVLLNTRVAMKFLLPQYAHDQRVVARFLREARAAVSLKNRHVASVIDIGTLESGSPYIVMEYLEGRDLFDVIEEAGHIEALRTARLLLQACQGLASAHASGVVHRDIKPGNLFLTHDVDGSEQIKILDFGISKSGQEVTNLTRTGAVMGSPMYMSPEQMRSTRNVDHRTDIWSLGVVGFEMLTGRLPYEAETMTELVAMVLEHDPPRASMLRPDVPRAIDDAIAKALTKDMNERYTDIAWFAHDLALALGDPMSLESAARTQRILSGGAGLTGSDPAVKLELPDAGRLPSGNTQGSFIRTRPGAREEASKPRRLLPALAIVMVAILAGVTFGLLSRSPEPAEPPVEAATPPSAPIEPAAPATVTTATAPSAPPAAVAEPAEAQPAEAQPTEAQPAETEGDPAVAAPEVEPVRPVVRRGSSRRVVRRSRHEDAPATDIFSTRE